MTQKDKVKELVGRGLHSYHTKALQQMDRIEKKNKEQNHKISILSNELDNDYLTKTEEGSVVSLEHSKEGMVYLDELQGNTLVNYCTDGSKEMTLNGDIDVEGVSVTTTEGVDNGLVDVMCEGNTLVNLSNTKEVLNKNKSHYDDIYLCELSRIKPNVSYTVIYDFECNIDFTFDICYVGYSITTPSVMIEQFSGNRHYAKKGKNIMCFNLTIEQYNVAIEKGAKYFQIRVFIDNEKKEKQYSSKNIMLLEGDWTDKEIPPYFEGMKSVGQDDENGHKIEILSSNKNLVVSGFQNGNIGNDGNLFNQISYLRSVDYEHCAPNTEILATYNGLFRFSQFFFYDKDKRFIDRKTETRATVPSNAKYFKLVLAKKDGTEVTSGDINSYANKTTMVRLSNQTSVYVEPKLNKKEILLNEPLRGLPNGVKDRFVKIGGKPYIERNCGYIFLDNTRNWTYNTGHNNPIFECSIKNDIVLTSDIIGDRLLCDKLESKAIYSTNENYGICFVNGSFCRIRINGYTTSEEYNNWINNNSLNVVYQLPTPVYEPLEIEPTLSCYSEVTHFSNNSIIPCNMKIQNSGYNAIIKPSTLYTIALDINKSGTVGMNLGGVKGTTTNNVLTLTTPATLTDDSLRLYGKGIKGSKVRLLEGDKTNWIPSHFEGMKSSFEDKFDTTDNTYKMEILSNNKNLLNNLQDTKFSTSNSDIQVENNSIKITVKTEHRGWYYHDFKFSTLLKPNTKYTIKCDIKKSNSNSKACFRIFDLGATIDYGYIHNSGSFTFTTPLRDIDDLRILVYSSIDNIIINQGDTIEYTNIQLVEGDTINIVPNQEFNKIQFSSIEPLRSLPNGNCDRFVFKDNKLFIERNCGVITLDKLKQWNVSTTDGDKKTLRFWSHALYPSVLNLSYNRDNLYCDKLANYDYANTLSTIDNMGIAIQPRENDTQIQVRINKNLLQSLNQEGLNNYFENNIYTVVYEFRNPTYEEVPHELQKIILEGYENGTLFFDTNIPPTSTVTYAGETPIVKSVKLNKTEVLNNTNDINDNIIPYLMDMDYRVVCLQLESNVEGISMARLFGGTYEMLKRDIQSNRLTKEEYGYRLIDYFNAGKLTEEEVRELEDLK